jgi:hypothetical protein
MGLVSDSLSLSLSPPHREQLVPDLPLVRGEMTT